MTKFSIDPATHIGAVELTISDLERSIGFYESRLGFVVHRRDEGVARLGAGGADLLVLSESRDAPEARGTTGLYHFAILTPTRTDLGRAMRRLVETRTVLQGAADHGVSEAIYLADPDDNGIEIYRDRPRVEWPFIGDHLRMGADPLDLEGLLSDSAGATSAALARGTIIGHVHLHVSHLDQAEWFYTDVLGFDLMQRYGPSALFVSAGGYHHHIGLNTWAGVGAPPPPAGAIGLKFFVVELPHPAAVSVVAERLRSAKVPVDTTEDGIVVRDPAGNSVKFQVPLA